MSVVCINGGSVIMLARLIAVWAVLTSAGSVAAQPIDSRHELELRYEMRGEVRLLLFWVGKDDVGGGTIAIRESRTGTERSEEVEVCFGSNPERVPGKVNRWGYGVERAHWKADRSDGEPILVKTSFEGLIRHSKEESLSEVSDSSRREQSEQLYWYDAIRTVVEKIQAISEVRYFSDSSDFDYRNPEALLGQYRTGVSAAPADKVKRLLNQAGAYDRPYGFLSGMRFVTRALVKDLSISKESDRSLEPYTLVYVHNARTYRLSVDNLKIRERFIVEGGEGEEPASYSPVAEVKFRVLNIPEGRKQNFKLWLPLEGELAGLPVQIEYQPRWWLRVKLKLVDALQGAETAVPSRVLERSES